MHSELMLSPSPSTSGTEDRSQGSVRDGSFDHSEEHIAVESWGGGSATTDPPVFLMGKSDFLCIVEGSSFIRSDSCRLKGDVF